MTNIPTPAEIREARKGLNLSQAQMADIMGYASKDRIRELETGRTRMTGPAAVLFRLVFGAHAKKSLTTGEPIPRLPNCGRYMAIDNKGQWHYLNHTNTWQGFQGFSSVSHS